jgi:tetratricopeptide (TPR) repeat protein
VTGSPSHKILRAAALAGLLVAACSTAGTNLVKQVSTESRQSLAAGDFQKAIDPYKVAFQRDPGNKELAAGYAGTLEEIRRVADVARGRQDHEQAGRIYRVLLNNYADYKALAPTLTFQKPYLEASLRTCRVALADAQARQAMKAGNAARALDLSSAVLKEYPGNADAKANGGKLVQEIKASADKAMADKDYARAGRLYVLVLKDSPSFEGGPPAAPLDRAAITKALATCREVLTKTGLEEYRKGNLTKAIAVWEGLLSFDPDNTEIKKAVQTAKTQQGGIIKRE